MLFRVTHSLSHQLNKLAYFFEKTFEPGCLTQQIHKHQTDDTELEVLFSESWGTNKSYMIICMFELVYFPQFTTKVIFKCLTVDFGEIMSNIISEGITYLVICAVKAEDNKLN